MAIIVTKNNFKEEVLDSKVPVLVDFWAAWCGPCKMLAPVLDEVADARPDIKICKINIDEQPELAAQFAVMSIPTLIVFKDGKAVNKTVGLQPVDAILSIV